MLGTGDQWIKLVKEREAWVLDKRQNQKPNVECRQSSKFGIGGGRLSFGLGEFEMGAWGGYSNGRQVAVSGGAGTGRAGDSDWSLAK